MTTRSSAVRPPVIGGPVGKSALTRTHHHTTANVKGLVVNQFSNLNDFVVLARNPVISGGRLAGEGVVRHRDEMMTDDYIVKAVVGVRNSGKTRLVTCGSPSFSSFYGLEVETGIVNNRFHIIKGSGTTALLDGGIISAVDKYATVTRNANPGDEVGVWWDQEASRIRVFHNGSQVTSLPVPRWEISHGLGFRNWGVAQGVDLFLGLLNPGVEFTAISAEDV